MSIRLGITVSFFTEKYFEGSNRYEKSKALFSPLLHAN